MLVSECLLENVSNIALVETAAPQKNYK